MPTYVYRREDGTTFDVFQRISDPTLTEDPETGKPVVRVIMGGAGLQFKGTGFYGTDYVKKSGTPDATPDATPAKAEAASSEASSSKTSSSKTSSSEAKTAAPAAAPAKE